jgi:hypothetical protein
MYSELIGAVKDHIQTTVNVMEIQTGYLGDFQQIDLRIPAILLEPRTHEPEAKSTRWREGPFQIRLWVMVDISRDYLASMKELEDLLGANDQISNLYGLEAALDQLRESGTFKTLTGSRGGKVWRIGSKVLDIGRTTFGINQRGSGRINTAQLELGVIVEIER